MGEKYKTSLQVLRYVRLQVLLWIAAKTASFSGQGYNN